MTSTCVIFVTVNYTVPMHPIFSVDKQGLQLLLYNDDVEICNPLGSKSKIHKMCKHIKLILII